MAALVETNKSSSSSMSLFIWFLEVIVVLVFCSYVVTLCLTLRPPIYTITNINISTTNGESNAVVQDHVEMNHQNTSLSFTLVITNPNKAKNILYDETKITVYKNGSIYDTSSLPRFYQDGVSHLSRQVIVHNKQHELNQEDLSENNIIKVEVKTNVRYKILAWTTKKHGLSLEAYLPVDMNGRFLLHPEGLKLKPIRKFLVPRYKF